MMNTQEDGEVDERGEKARCGSGLSSKSGGGTDVGRGRRGLYVLEEDTAKSQKSTGHEPAEVARIPVSFSRVVNALVHILSWTLPRNMALDGPVIVCSEEERD